MRGQRWRRRWLYAAIGAVVIVAAAPLLASEPCEWVVTSGEVALENVTREEAIRLAIRSARARAVEQVAGVEVHAQTLVRDEVLAAEFLRALARGYVLHEQVLRWEQKNFEAASDKPPLTLYRVFLKACVAREGDPHDPYFTVSAELNKGIFVTGEQATIRIRCTQPCYVNILNLSGIDQFSLLLPNSYQKTLRLTGGEEFVFPPPGLALRMAPVPGHRRDAEAFLVVATKGPLNLPAILRKQDGITFEEVSRILFGLPAAERAEALLVYEVRAE